MKKISDSETNTENEKKIFSRLSPEKQKRKEVEIDVTGKNESLAWGMKRRNRDKQR